MNVFSKKYIKDYMINLNNQVNMVLVKRYKLLKFDEFKD